MKRTFAFVFGLVFTALFAALGGVGLWAAGSVAWHYRDSADWVKTRAQVEAFDGTTLRYKYVADGREITGSRVLLPPLPQAGPVPDDVAERIRAARSGERSFFVYYDPDAPERSVADRGLPWIEAIMAAPFVLAFCGMALSTLRALLHIARGAAPWPQATAVIQGQQAAPAFLWIFATIWSAITFTLAILAVPAMLYEGSWPALLILLFPLIGVSLYWAAFRASLEKLCPAPPARAPSPPNKPGRRKALA